MSSKKTMQPKIFNPFEGRDPQKVWKEIRENTEPTTREKALAQMASIRKKENK